MIDFIHEVTDPYLNVFRRILPPVGGGGFALDLSPIIAIFVLHHLARDRRGRDRPRVSAGPQLSAHGAWTLAPARRWSWPSTRSRSRSRSPSVDPGHPEEIIFGIELSNVRNRGVAFGLLGGGGDLVVAITLAALALLLVYFAIHATRPGLWLAVGLVVGGALGNLADRVRIGAAIDFIDPPLWPAFNLADVAIVARCGVACSDAAFARAPTRARCRRMSSKCPRRPRDSGSMRGLPRRGRGVSRAAGREPDRRRQPCSSTACRGRSGIACEAASGSRSRSRPTETRPSPTGPAPRIAWQNDDLLVIDKPAGLVVHPAPGHAGATLVELLARDAGTAWEPLRRAPARPGHLGSDAGRQGEPEISDELQQLIRARGLVREYLALAEGTLGSRSGTIEAPIGRDARDRTRMAVGAARAREARTHFEVERFLDGFTLVRARLETGRTHQIRAHFAAIGHPLAGDRAYGGQRVLGLERQFLHSARIAFELLRRAPGGVEERSPLPADLAEALRAGRPADHGG